MLRQLLSGSSRSKYVAVMKVLKLVGDKKYGYYIQEATISTYTILGRQ